MQSHQPEIRFIDETLLVVDPVVQRGLDPHRVRKIAAEFVIEAFGVPVVSHREDGSYHVVDGQTRIAARRLAQYADPKVLCRVHEGLSLADEAELFRLLNNTKQPQAIDLFRVRVIERDPAALAVTAICETNGWKVGKPPGRGVTSAVVAMEHAYARNPEAFQHSMSVLTMAFGHDRSVGDGRLIEGLSLVLGRYGSAIAVEELVRRLQEVEGGAVSIINKAATLRAAIGRPIIQCIAEIIVELYNARRRTRTVAPWRTA